jgi:hypothetical protein
MPYFAYVKDAKVEYVQFVSTSSPVGEKWVALNRSGVTLKYSSHYDVMPGDVYVDGKFYKKDIDTGETTLLEDGAWTHPKAVRFAGIMEEEIVGQWGIGKEMFASQEEIDEFVAMAETSDVVELKLDEQFIVEKGWLYDGVNFTNPDNA